MGKIDLKYPDWIVINKDKKLYDLSRNIWKRKSKFSEDWKKGYAAACHEMDEIIRIGCDKYI